MKGLDNLGNTCYFNSIIQCLLQVPQLSNYYMIKKYDGKCMFTKEYQKFVQEFWKTKETPSPKILLNIFKRKCKHFDNFDQHDSQEALMSILDILQPQDFIKRVFESKVTQETVCKSETSKKEEEVMVNIDWSDDWSTLEGFQDSKGQTHHVAVTRRLFEQKAPVLIFSQSQKRKIKVPEYEGYKLFATCTHSGSFHGGHYIAYTLHKDQWYLKNDRLSMKIDTFPEEGYHYILFYKRISNVM